MAPHTAGDGVREIRPGWFHADALSLMGSSSELCDRFTPEQTHSLDRGAVGKFAMVNARDIWRGHATISRRCWCGADGSVGELRRRERCHD